MESKKDKGKRFILGSYLAIIVVLFAAPIGAYAGQAVNNTVAHSTVLQGESQVMYLYGSNNTSLPFGNLNGTAEVVPSANATSIYGVSNATLSELNFYDVNQVTLNTGYSGNETIQIGYGTNSSNFKAFAQVNAYNNTSVSVPIYAVDLNGNQSQLIMFKVQSNATELFLSMQFRGNNGLTRTILSPAMTENIGYVIGGIILVGLAFLIVPWYDIDIRLVKQKAKSQYLQYRQKRRTTKARKRYAKGGR